MGSVGLVLIILATLGLKNFGDFEIILLRANMSEFAKGASATVDEEVLTNGSIACHYG